MADCNTEKKGLGVSRCVKLPGLIKSMITTPVGFFFTAAQVADEDLFEAALQAAILDTESNRVHVWPNFVMFEDISEAAVYEDTPLAYLAVRDGNYRFRVGVKESMCLHRAMFTHRAVNGRVFLFDGENQLIGTQDAAGNFYGFTIQLLHTEKMKFSDGTVSTKSPILLALGNNKELDEDGAIVAAPFFNTVDRLTDVKLTLVSAIPTKIIVTAEIECDGTALNGLVLADFVFLDEAGSPQTITSVTEVDGTYTLNKSGTFGNGTLSLEAPDALSIQAYESNDLTVPITT